MHKQVTLPSLSVNAGDAMSDEHDELKRQAAALREIMNKPFEPSGYNRKRQGNSAARKTKDVPAAAPTMKPEGE